MRDASNASYLGLGLFLILGLCVSMVLLAFGEEIVTPLDEELPEGEISVVIPSAVGKKLGKYSVYLPEGYHDKANAKRTYPILFVDLALGNSERYFEKFEDWLKQNKWICVMPTDVKNGPSEDIEAQYAVIFPDIKKRFRITPHCGVMTGSSGGSRRATRFGYDNQDIFGGIINNSLIGHDAPHCSDPEMLAMVLMGVGDYCIPQIQEAIDHLDPDHCRIRLHRGGHGLAPLAVRIEAMDWMAAKLLSYSDQPEQIRDMMSALNTNIEASESLSEGYQTKKRYLSLFDSQPSLQKDSQLQAIALQYRADVKELDQDKDFDFEIELEAIAALQGIRMQYTIQIGESLSWAPRSLKPESEYGEKVLSTTADARNKAIADLKKFEKSYRGTGAAKESKNDVKTIKEFTKSWTGQGEKE